MSSLGLGRVALLICFQILLRSFPLVHNVCWYGIRQMDCSNVRNQNISGVERYHTFILTDANIVMDVNLLPLIYF